MESPGSTRQWHFQSWRHRETLLFFFFLFFFRTLLLLESFTVTFKEFASCFVASGFQETGVCLRAPSCFGCFVVLPWPPGHFLPFFFLFLILSLSLLHLCMPEGEGGKGAVWVLCVTGFTTLRNIDSFPEGAPCVCVGNGFVLNGNVPLAGVEKQGQRER